MYESTYVDGDIDYHLFDVGITENDSKFAFSTDSRINFSSIFDNVATDIFDGFPSLEETCSTQDESEEITMLMNKIEQDENSIKKSNQLLELEKQERLKVQEELCTEISNHSVCDLDSAFFLRLCNFEANKSAGNIEKSVVKPKRKLVHEGKKHLNPKESFIARNIELASKAMSKENLTDEEKQHLNELLSDSVDDDLGHEENQMDENNEVTNNTNINAYLVTADDQRIMDEIDLQLEGFEDATVKSPSENQSEDNFWKNLLLDQRLKDIDLKLANLSNEQESSKVKE